MADTGSPYWKLTIPKLKSELANRGVYYTSALRKPALLQLLVENDRDREGSEGSGSKTHGRSDVPHSENDTGSELGTGGAEAGKEQDLARGSQDEEKKRRNKNKGKAPIRPPNTMPQRERQTSDELTADADATAPYIEMSIAQLAAECEKRGIPTSARWEMDQYVRSVVEDDLEAESEREGEVIRRKEPVDAERTAAMARSDAMQPILEVSGRREEGASGKGMETDGKVGDCDDEEGDVVESVE